MKKIIWLASYPKSGNTWLRLLLENIFRPEDAPVCVNDFQVTRSDFHNRSDCDETFGVESSDLTGNELLILKRDYIRTQAETLSSETWVKTHEANARDTRGEMMIPPEVTMAAIYLVRHPWDVVVSLAAHCGISITQAVAMLDDEEASLAAGRFSISPLLELKLGRWRDHVLQWSQTNDFPVFIVRYEDLHATPESCLLALLKNLGIEKSKDIIHNAVLAAEFKVLQRFESDHNFTLKPVGMPKFFRHGRPGEGAEVLTDDEKLRILQNNKDVMSRWDYLPGIAG
ncbi:MAG: sulfotransferase domain-containing protein [Synoicihabitans sp.]